MKIGVLLATPEGKTVVIEVGCPSVLLALLVVYGVLVVTAVEHLMPGIGAGPQCGGGGGEGIAATRDTSKKIQDKQRWNQADMMLQRD